MGQTGSTKALSLLNWNLFVMWDTKIRKKLRKELIKGIGNGNTSKEYIIFLNGIRKYILDYNLEKKINDSSPIAKKIDEFHYLEVIMGGKSFK